MAFRNKVSLTGPCVLALAVAAALAAYCGCRPAAPSPREFDVAFLMDAGGFDDKGRNAMIWRACQRLTEENPGYLVVLDYCAPATAAEGRSFLTNAAGRAADVVVVASPTWEADVATVARRSPYTKFLVVGGHGGGGNVKALSYPAYEAGYLMGVAAASSAPAGGFGFIGGREDDATRALASGYAAGARAEAPGAPVTAEFLGRDFGAPLEVARARATAASMFGRGVAVIFAAAGAANVEIAAEAKTHSKFIIGFESNQNYLERGYVITSLNIRWDDIVYRELRAVMEGRFEGGVRAIPIDSELIGYPIDANNRALIPAAAVLKIEAARQRLAAGADAGGA